MHNKKLFIIAVALLPFAVGNVLFHALGIPLKDAIAGIVICTLYGLLIVSYVLRFALIFLGVFALYRMIQKRHYKQITA